MAVCGSAPIIYLVVPCYNEAEVLPDTAAKLRAKLHYLIAHGQIAPDSRILFVNDGSKDNTWQIISSLHAGDPTFSGLNLSRNRGHQNALLAGLMAARDNCAAAISLDADLQDDINAIDQMVVDFEAGIDIVYGVRDDRTSDTGFKRVTAERFYKLMQRFGVETIDNHADYRLMSRRALDALAQYQEVNLFLRAIVPQLGFPTASVPYKRGKRLAGETKYPLKKMLSFAADGVTSFSIAPIRIVTIIGSAIFILALIASVGAIIDHFWGTTETGWASLMVSIWAGIGLQMLTVGIVGEYIGKIYLETKRRPRYIIDTFLDSPSTELVPTGHGGRIGSQIGYPPLVTTPTDTVSWAGERIVDHR